MRIRTVGLVGAVVIVLAVLVVIGMRTLGSRGVPELSAKEIASRSSEAMGQLKSFHFALETQGGTMSLGQGIAIRKADGDLVVPDKMRLSFTGSFAGMSVELQMVSLGKQQYIQNPLGKKWQTMKSAFDPSALFRPEDGVPSLMTRAGDLEKVGREKIGDVDCYHLKGTLTAKDLAVLGADPSSPATSRADAWVGVSDFRVRQITLEGPVASGEKDGMTRTVRLSQFDEPFDIQPPM
jgi:hypothetical protein